MLVLSCIIGIPLTITVLLFIVAEVTDRDGS
jgi:hypothetical protein